jgi:hypothetical protein
MKRIYVGTFILNCENVRVYATDATDGSVALLYPKDKGAASMSVSCHGSWSYTLGGLMHEAMEFCLNRNRHAFYPTLCGGSSLADFQFIFNHEQMNAVAYALGRFVGDVTPALSKAFKTITRARGKL